MNTIVLWEHQKQRVCEYYECSDSHDKQYPGCKGDVLRTECNLRGLQTLLEFISEEQPCTNKPSLKS